jgi:hypothetical protein
MSLQSMVDEILLKKNGKTIKNIADKPLKTKPTFFLTRNKNLIANGVDHQNDSDDTKSQTSSTSRDMYSNTVFEDNTVISNDDL